MNLIVVVDKNWGIGKNNGLLFRLKKDMAFFRETTTGKVVVMGANTFRSFPNGALPNRQNIVLDSGCDMASAEVCSGTDGNRYGTYFVSTVQQLDALLAAIETSASTDDIFVIGGASVYRLMLSRCATAYVTKVDADGEATLFFPNLDNLPDWQLVEQSDPIDDNGYTIRFCRYTNTAI